MTQTKLLIGVIDVSCYSEINTHGESTGSVG